MRLCKPALLYTCRLSFLAYMKARLSLRQALDFLVDARHLLSGGEPVIPDNRNSVPKMNPVLLFPMDARFRCIMRALLFFFGAFTLLGRASPVSIWCTCTVGQTSLLIYFLYPCGLWLCQFHASRQISSIPRLACQPSTSFAFSASAQLSCTSPARRAPIS